MSTAVRYVSTRGAAPELGFVEVVLAGLARDGGLYVPQSWPHLEPSSASTSSSTSTSTMSNSHTASAAVGRYDALATEVMAPYCAPDIGVGALAELTAAAYSGFRHPQVVPIVEVGEGIHLQELFHGPTLAFKDLALQFLGRLFDQILSARGEHLTILGATSGDTGSAAIEGLRHCRNATVVILYPAGRISEVQRRQMTTVTEPNIHAVAVEGTFDDCQDLVKSVFSDTGFRDEHRLSAVNSINWARVMAQVVYYVAACRHFDGDEIDIAVPTGNFGNVLSGWIAKQSGAPIGRLVVASNTNDILTRFLEGRTMSTRDVVATVSPSMDIQVSSNFERLLFEVNGRDGQRTASQLDSFRSEGTLSLTDDQFERWIAPTFVGARCDDQSTIVEIAGLHRQTGILIDPHTAVGMHAARRWRREGVPMVTLATAHPAKFPDAVEQATGVRPMLPEHLADLFERPERLTRLPNDPAAVRTFVASL